MRSSKGRSISASESGSVIGCTFENGIVENIAEFVQAEKTHFRAIVTNVVVPE